MVAIGKTLVSHFCYCHVLKLSRDKLIQRILHVYNLWTTYGQLVCVNRVNFATS
jgi:hypothetical protein